MINNALSVDEAIEYLNSVQHADPLALRALMCVFIPCNQALADHPTAQIRDNWEEGYTIGVLGLINGLFGTDEDGWGAIAYKMKDDKPIEFCKAADFKASRKQEEDAR